MKHAFSLIELSIVLVILGLLVGGILAGQSLIRAAELRSVTTDFQKYQSAAYTFRDKYFALPGDMINAASFWPGAADGGDGDGRLEAAGAVSSPGERYGFWEQLALAGLIDGHFDGMATSTDVHDASLGVNVPRGTISNSGWSMYYSEPFSISDLGYFQGSYGNMILFGGKIPNGFTTNAILKPEEAWNIDIKLDDGKPAFGLVRTYESQGDASNGCSNPAASSSAIEAVSVYDLNYTANACSLIFTPFD